MTSPDFRAGWDAAVGELRSFRAVVLHSPQYLADYLASRAPEVTGQAEPAVYDVWEARERTPPNPETAARERLDWQPFSLDTFPEGSTAIFCWYDRQGYPGFFVDRITWDSETPPSWDEGNTGLDFDDVRYYALFNEPDRAAESAERGKGEK